MYSGKSVAIISLVILGVSFGLGYLAGQNGEKTKSYNIQVKTNKVFKHIQNTYPEQWETIQDSRPYIEYEVAKQNK